MGVRFVRVCVCVCVCGYKCLYNCVRVLNNGIDILLLSYDQERFVCIKGLIAETWARECQCRAGGVSVSIKWQLLI